MEIFILWLVFAGLVGALASSRGRSGFGFFLLSVLLSPLVGLVIVLVIRNLAEDERRDEERRREEQRKEFDRKREHEKQLEAIRAAAQPPQQPAGASPQLTVAEEIAKLGELLQKGLLTQDEFDTQKAAVLRRGA